MKREKFLQKLKFNLYHEEILMKHKVNKSITFSGRSTSVVTFSIKAIILRMVTYKSFSHQTNLLQNPQDPFTDPHESVYYGEADSGSWFKETK